MQTNSHLTTINFKPYFFLLSLLLLFNKLLILPFIVLD